MNTPLDPAPQPAAGSGHAPGASASAAITRSERHLEILAELAEIGLALAREAAALDRKKVQDALDGWTYQMPTEAGSAFSKLAQTVRRTIALEAHLRAGMEAMQTQLFGASPFPPLTLDPKQPICRFVDAPAAASPTVTEQAACAPTIGRKTPALGSKRTKRGVDYVGARR